MGCSKPCSLSSTISQSLLRSMSTELVMPSNHLILCHALLLPPSMFPSNRAFSKELSLCIRWPKFWSTGFSISSSNEYSGLVFFRIDCFVLLEIQGAPQSLLQDHSLKAPIFQCSVFFMVQLSHVYMIIEKNHSFDYIHLSHQRMSLLFNILSRFVIAFLPRSKHPLISWLQSPSTVILEPKKIKSVTASMFYPSTCHEVMESDAMILVIQW